MTNSTAPDELGRAAGDLEQWDRRRPLSPDEGALFVVRSQEWPHEALQEQTLLPAPRSSPEPDMAHDILLTQSAHRSVALRGVRVFVARSKAVSHRSQAPC